MATVWFLSLKHGNGNTVILLAIHPLCNLYTRSSNRTHPHDHTCEETSIHSSPVGEESWAGGTMRWWVVEPKHWEKLSFSFKTTQDFLEETALLGFSSFPQEKKSQDDQQLRQQQRGEACLCDQLADMMWLDAFTQKRSHTASAELRNHTYGHVHYIHAMCHSIGTVPVEKRSFIVQTFAQISEQFFFFYNPIIPDLPQRLFPTHSSSPIEKVWCLLSWQMSNNDQWNNPPHRKQQWFSFWPGLANAKLHHTDMDLPHNDRDRMVFSRLQGASGGLLNLNWMTTLELCQIQTLKIFHRFPSISISMSCVHLYRKDTI